LFAQSCAVALLGFHQTTAEEHEFNKKISNYVKSQPEIKEVYLKNKRLYESNSETPFFWIVIKENSIAYAELGQEFTEPGKKASMVTQTANESDIDIFWKVLIDGLKSNGYVGSVVMDTYPGGVKKRYTTKI